MVSSLQLLVFIKFLAIIHGLLKPIYAPEVSEGPGYHARCMISDSTKDVSVCGAYKDEVCPFLCWYLVAQLFRQEKTCYKGKRTSEMTTILLTICQRNCYLARQQIFSKENHSETSNLGALISVTAKPNRAVQGKSHAFENSPRSFLSFSQKAVDFDMNPCTCFACRKNHALCPACCMHIDHVTVWSLI